MEHKLIQLSGKVVLLCYFTIRYTGTNPEYLKFQIDNPVLLNVFIVW